MAATWFGIALAGTTRSTRCDWKGLPSCAVSPPQRQSGRSWAVVRLQAPPSQHDFVAGGRRRARVRRPRLHRRLLGRFGTSRSGAGTDRRRPGRRVSSAAWGRRWDCGGLGHLRAPAGNVVTPRSHNRHSVAHDTSGWLAGSVCTTPPTPGCGDAERPSCARLLLAHDQCAAVPA